MSLSERLGLSGMRKNTQRDERADGAVQQTDVLTQTPVLAPLQEGIVVFGQDGPSIAKKTRRFSIFRRGNTGVPEIPVTEPDIPPTRETPPTQVGTDDGGEPPVGNNGIEDHEWDENERRIAEIIGWENVTAVRMVSNRLRDITAFYKKDDPFKEARSGETIIDGATKEAMDYMTGLYRRRYKITGSENTTAIRRRVPKLSGITKRYIPEIESALETSTAESGRLQARIDELATPAAVTDTDIEQNATNPTQAFIDDVATIHDELEASAAAIPLANTIKDVDVVLLTEFMASDLDGYITGRGKPEMHNNVTAIDAINTSRVDIDTKLKRRYTAIRDIIVHAGQADILARLVHRTDKEINRDSSTLKRAKTVTRKLAESGTRMYQQVREKIQSGSNVPIDELYQTLIGIEEGYLNTYGPVPEQLTGDDLENAVLVEGYLNEKAKFLEDTIRELQGRVPPEQRRTLRRQQQTKYGPALKRANKAQEAEKQESLLPEDFRKATGLINTILKGGGRISAKGAKQFAKDLHGIYEDNETFPPPARGLIVSLATETFDLEGVLGVLDEFTIEKEDDGSELIRALRQQMRERYDAIKHFDRASLLKIVNSATEIIGEGQNDATIREDTSNRFGEDRMGLIRKGLQEIRNRLTGREDVVELGAFEQLDWTVLPEGQLQNQARELVHEVLERSSNPESVEIDLERLTILEMIKASWDKGDAKYARGKLGNRRVVKIDEDTNEPEEYIILVLPYIDDTGHLREHAIAESPIARRNKLYMHRDDVSDSDWRHVFSQPKEYAQAYGARGLKHTIRNGQSLIASMVQKTSALLEISAEEFPTKRADRL